jgi:nicotinamide mononucleotide transporter
MTSGLASLCAWLTAHGSSCPETLGFVTGVANVWLVTRQSLWSWPIGVLNALFYMVVFAQAGLYSDTGLQVVYFALSLYGWWSWWRGAPDRSPLVVTRTPRVLAWRLAAIAVTTWILLSVITSRIPGAALPWFDSALVATSLVAMFMMTRKLLENWTLWIMVDVLYIALFINRGLPLTAVLYAVFLVLAVVGHVQWKRAMPRPDADPPFSGTAGAIT